MDVGKGTPNGVAQGVEVLSLMLNVLLLVLVALVYWLAPGGSIFVRYFAVFLIFAAIIYLVEAFCCSSTLGYLRNVADADSISARIDRLVRQRPRIFFYGEAYHTETTIDIDAEGRTQTGTKRVVTWTGTKDFTFDSWSDTSEAFHMEPGSHMTKLKLTKSFTCADAWTKQCLSRECQAFKEMVRGKDRRYSMSCKMAMNGFVDRILVLDPNGASTVGPEWYALFTLVGCSWPYRMYVRNLTVRLEHNIRKTVQCRAPQASLPAPQVAIRAPVMVPDSDIDHVETPILGSVEDSVANTRNSQRAAWML